METEENQAEGPTYDELVTRVSAIANPLAPRKFTKKLYKTIKKAQKAKMVRRGVRDVQKFIRKGERGFIVLAGDVTPIEVMCHIPGICEDTDIPYVYTPSRQDLGSAMGTKRSVSCLLIKLHDDYSDLYQQCVDQIKQLPPPV